MSDIPQEVVNVVSNLSVISGLPSGAKLNSGKLNYAAADSWIDNFFRFMNNESSEKSLDFINNTITEAVKVAKKYEEWKDKICEYVVAIERAVLNLSHVYRKEPATLAQIEIIKLRITKEAFNKACVVMNKQSPRSLRREFESSEPIPITGGSLARSAPEKSKIFEDEYEKIDIGSASSVDTINSSNVNNKKNKK